MFTCLLLVTHLLQLAVALDFESVFNQLVHKTKSFYEETFHSKPTAWQLDDYDRTQYPGTNNKLLDTNKAKWNVYYNCLEAQEKSLENHGSIVPEAVLRLKGQHIKFECKVCLGPSELADSDSIEWFYSLDEFDNKLLLPIDITEHVLISPTDKTLHMYNLQPEQSGQYVCKLHNMTSAPYFLTVNQQEPVIVVNRTSKLDGNVIKFNGGVLMVDTLWGEWTKCSRCKKVGRRHKTGICTVLFDPDANADTTTTTTKTMRKVVKGLHLHPNYVHLKTEELDIFKVFRLGIPCRSRILPTVVSLYIKNRPSQILTGFCKVKCHSEKDMFVLKDNNGNVLEVANNSAGEYSLLQTRPNDRPPIENQLQYEESGNRITIACPGNLNEDVPVEWHISNGSRLITWKGKRVYVTASDEIVIEKAHVSDSNLYSCWQGDELAGTVTLVVQTTYKLQFDHHILLFGLLIIIGTFFYVLFKALYMKSVILTT